MKRLTRNVFFQTIYQVIAIIVPLIVAPYVSRILMPEGVGTYGYAHSIVNYFVVFSNLGIANYGNRLIAQSKHDRDLLNSSFSGTFYLHAIISASTLVLYISYIFIFQSANSTIYLILGLFIIGSLLDISWLYFGLEKFVVTSLTNSAIKLLSAVCIFLFVKSTDDLLLYSLIMSSVNIAANVVFWLFLRKNASFVKVSGKEMFRHFPPMAILFLPTLAISLYQYMDKIMIGNYLDYENVGYYECAEKIVNITTAIINAVGIVMLPHVSKLKQREDYPAIKKSISQVLCIMSCLSMAILFGILSIANTFIPLYFGDDYSPSIVLVELLTLMCVFVSWANVMRTQYLIPFHKDWQYTISLFAGAVINIVLNIIFIKSFGVVGAAIATVAAQAAVCIIQGIFMAAFYNYQKGKDFLYLFVFAAFGFVMFLAVTYLPLLSNQVLSIVLKVAVGAAVYLTLSFIYFFFVLKVWRKKHGSKETA